MKATIVWTILIGLALNGWRAAGADGDAKPAPRVRVDPLKKYDKDGDGKLNDQEKAAVQKDRAEMRKEFMAQLLKKYDKNGNGKLDEDELQARRADLEKEREAQLAKRQSERKQKEEKPKDSKQPNKDEKK